MASEHVFEVTDSNFEQALQSANVPVLVDFGAERCIPCRAVEQHVDALAKQYEGRIRVGRCDVDANQEIAIRYQILNLPTLLMFKEGRVVGQIVGAVPRARIEDLVKKALA